MRLSSLSRNTVRKWLKAPVLEEPKYRRSGTPGKRTPFHDAIKQALKVDAHRPRHERRTVRAWHSQIKSQHDALPAFSGVMLGVAVPLTVVTPVVVVIRPPAAASAP